MSRTVFQVPMPKILKEQAELVAFNYGFSSLQEVVRFILNKLVKGELTINVSEAEQVNVLSKTASRRYKQALKDIKSGKNIFKPKNLDEFFKMLQK